MKSLVKLLIICFVVSGVSCTNKWASMVPKSSFDAPFPRANKDLTELLGNKLYIKRGKDTTVFNIINKGDKNLIIDKNSDTIFFGVVSRYKGLLYFSQQLNDT